VNGIEDVVGRADLADRGIFLTLAPIGEQYRRSETELWHEFASVQPRILAGLLDALGCGHRLMSTFPRCRGWQISPYGRLLADLHNFHVCL
jgi:hypothetical protein